MASAGRVGADEAVVGGGAEGEMRRGAYWALASIGRGNMVRNEGGHQRC